MARNLAESDERRHVIAGKSHARRPWLTRYRRRLSKFGRPSAAVRGLKGTCGMLRPHGEHTSWGTTAATSSSAALPSNGRRRRWCTHRGDIRVRTSTRHRRQPRPPPPTPATTGRLIYQHVIRPAEPASAHRRWRISEAISATAASSPTIARGERQSARKGFAGVSWLY